MFVFVLNIIITFIMRSQVTNFVSGGVGSGVAFMSAGQEVLQQPPVGDSQSIVVAIVTLVGGLVSTLLTNLIKKWLKVK